MTSIVFYFQVHQPYRLRGLRYHDVEPTDDGDREETTPRALAELFDDDENRRIVRRVAEKCYRPMNALITELIDTTDGAFRCAFSMPGVLLDQLRDWDAKTLDSFVALAETGNVEFLCETSHHSLASVGDESEFRAQIETQRARIEDVFGQRPTTFRNTELVISEAIAKTVEDLGFDALLGEGADRLLGWRSPTWPYRPRGCERLKLLLRHYPRSDDIGFRFSNPNWDRYPLYADTFASWLQDAPEHAAFIGLFMDYETFGEHQWEETGIFEFMRHLPRHVLEGDRFDFRTPAEVAAKHDAVAELAIPGNVSWADEERDLTAWLDNPMQRAAHARLYALLERLRRAGDGAPPHLLELWRKLSTSDHVYYMCSKYNTDGDVHEYFSPCENPHEAFVRFMSALDQFERELAGGGTAADAGSAPTKRRRRRRPSDDPGSSTSRANRSRTQRF